MNTPTRAIAHCLSAVNSLLPQTTEVSVHRLHLSDVLDYKNQLETENQQLAENNTQLRQALEIYVNSPVQGVMHNHIQQAQDAIAQSKPTLGVIKNRETDLARQLLAANHRNQQLAAELERVKKEVLEWKQICKNRDETVKREGEAWAKAMTQRDQLAAKVNQLREALKFISDWYLPRSSALDYTLVNKGEAAMPRRYECSYETAYGSNGARDYIRNIATKALSQSPAESLSEVVSPFTELLEPLVRHEQLPMWARPKATALLALYQPKEKK